MLFGSWDSFIRLQISCKHQDEPGVRGKHTFWALRVPFLLVVEGSGGNFVSVKKSLATEISVEFDEPEAR